MGSPADNPPRAPSRIQEADWFTNQLATLPTLEQHIDAQHALLLWQRAWLSRARELASFKVPPSLLALVPESVWRAPLWGHKVLVLHAPPVETTGLIELPKDSQRPTNYGWVIGVGPDVCLSEGRQAPTGGAVCPYGDPLMLIGEFVLFQLHSVREITFDVAQGGYGRREPIARVSLLMIADIWMPVIDVKPDDWKPKQPAVDTVLVTQ